MIVTQDTGILNDVYKMADTKKATGSDFINEMRKAVTNRDGNKIITIVGMPGSGKSWACLRLAEVLAPDGYFDPKFIAYNKKDFYDIVNSDFPRGQPIVYEEVGVNEGNRSWAQNMDTNKILQTFRHKNAILLMNTPVKTFVDKQARDLNHAIFWMRKILHNKKQSVMSPFFTEINPVSGETRTGWCVLKGDMISEIVLNIPSLELRKAYKKGKLEFTKKLNAKSLTSYAKKEKELMIEHRKKLDQAKQLGIEV